MIRPSNRRRPAPRASGDLDLHRRLARARDRHRRLMLSSAAALAAALATFAAGLDGAWRTGLVAAAIALPWLIPLRGGDRWALAWIRRHAGLAYQTALEARGGDSYGLRRALEEAARSATARLERPRHPAWWLPLLALALGAWLLPLLPSLTPNGLGGPRGGPASGPTAPADQAASEEDELPATDAEEGDRRLQQEPAGDEGASRTDEAEGAARDAANEREALDRFLENLRERPESEGREEQEPGRAGDGAGTATPPTADARERREGDPSQRRDPSGERAQGDEDEGDEGTGEEQAGGEGDAEGEEAQNPFAEAGAAQAETEDEGGEAPEENVAGEAHAEGDAGGEELDPQSRGDDGAGAGEDGGDEQQAESGEGAGGMAAAEQETGRAGRSEGERLFLEGELLPGPLTPGGEIQVPGRADGELPTAREQETYRREVDRALSEGRIPLEYQEIIRNYFR